ncbi:beta-lactamase family protein [bacterium]|nr:beta-lactamase family protein [bacterium]
MAKYDFVIVQAYTRIKMKEFKLLVISLLLFGCKPSEDQKTTIAEITPMNQAHIAHIEYGLYPIYNLEGYNNFKTIPQLMKEYGISGLSMAFVDSGKIAWTKCYGFADVKDSVKMGPATLLRAASLSKPMTAMAALHLVEEGKIKLNTDINTYLKGWKLPESEYTQDRKVNIADILAHRSGIKNDVHDGFRPDQSLPTLEEIFSGKTENEPIEMEFVPGDKRRYSNTGYMVLSELMQDVEEDRFEQIMKRIILDPCKMSKSTFSQELTKDQRTNVAQGYDENLNEVSYYKHASAGAGALWSTPSDIGLFLAEIMKTYHEPNYQGKIISHDMALKVFDTSNQTLGFNKSIDGKNFVFRHDGSIPGFNCTFMGSLNNNQAVVVMLNTGSELAYDFLVHLSRAVCKEYAWGMYEPEYYAFSPKGPEELKKFAGVYSNGDDSLEVILNYELIEFRNARWGHQSLIPVSDSEFINTKFPVKFEFGFENGKVKGVYVRDERGDGEWYELR